MAESRSEPTMEEILASIRRIIADPAPPRAPRKGLRSQEPDTGPVIEGEALPEPQSVPSDFENHFKAASEDMHNNPENGLTPSGESPETEEPVAAEPVSFEPSFTPAAAAEPVEEEDEILELTEIAHVPEASHDAILSAATASLAAERLQQLSQMVVRPEAGSMTLEGLVRDLLRPMMKEWLDANLPDIVDQVVSREIARLTGKPTR